MSGKPRASRSASQASATLRARLRIRPMVAVRSVTEITPRASSRLKVWLHFRTLQGRCRQLLLDQICRFRFIDGEQLLEPLGIGGLKVEVALPLFKRQPDLAKLRSLFQLRSQMLSTSWRYIASRSSP